MQEAFDTQNDCKTTSKRQPLHRVAANHKNQTVCLMHYGNSPMVRWASLPAESPCKKVMDMNSKLVLLRYGHPFKSCLLRPLCDRGLLLLTGLVPAPKARQAYGDLVGSCQSMLDPLALNHLTLPKARQDPLIA